MTMLDTTHFGETTYRAFRGDTQLADWLFATNEIKLKPSFSPHKSWRGPRDDFGCEYRALGLPTTSSDDQLV